LKVLNKKKVIIFSVLIVFLLALVGFGTYGAVQIKPIKTMAKELKQDVKVVVADLSTNNTEAATIDAAKMRADSENLRNKVSSPYWKTVAKLPVVGKQLQSAVKLTEILDSIDDDIIEPMIGLLDEYPSDTVVVDGAINGEALSAYVNFIDTIVPKMNSIADSMKDVNVSFVDSDGKIMGYIKQFITMTDVLTVASDRVISPLAQQISLYPTDEIKTDSGYNNEALRSYLIFVDNMVPEIQYVAEYIDSKDLSSLDAQGKLSEYASDLLQMSNLLSDASELVIRPLIDQLEACPLDNIKADDGFNVVVVDEYINFIEQVMPGFREVSAEMGNLQLARLDANGKVTEYKEKLDHIIETYDAGAKYIPLIHSLLGGGEDKFYVVAAQNTAEIRASGGFPGSVGTLEIKDGIMRIGDFKSVYKVFLYGVPRGADVTAEESRLFYRMNSLSWDAGFCPDFERVGEIWALAYEAKCNTHVDGVISMTPAVIQELLKFLGEIELSEGTILNGDNATAFIQHDIYVKYQNTYSEDYEGNSFVDDLFAETAKETMGLLVSEFKVKYMPEYLDMFTNGIENRTIMFWFADEDAQKMAVMLGSSGGINSDAEYPEAGVYFNLLNASKLGWYVDMSYDIVNQTANSDGSVTYDVEVKLGNIITGAEAASVSGYITYSGDIQYALYLFATEGGTVEYISADRYVNQSSQYYNGHELLFITGSLWTDSQTTITYRVTTAMGVDMPLTFSATPTLTQYRE